MAQTLQDLRDGLEKRLTNQFQTFHLAFEILTDKGKLFERIGRKATDLKVVRATQGGWATEVGFRPLLIIGVCLLGVGFKGRKEVKNGYLLYAPFSLQACLPYWQACPLSSLQADCN
jgi:hypothetical protein